MFCACQAMCTPAATTTVAVSAAPLMLMAAPLTRAALGPVQAAWAIRGVLLVVPPGATTVVEATAALTAERRHHPSEAWHVPPFKTFVVCSTVCNRRRGDACAFFLCTCAQVGAFTPGWGSAPAPRAPAPQAPARSLLVPCPTACPSESCGGSGSDSDQTNLESKDRRSDGLLRVFGVL